MSTQSLRGYSDRQFQRLEMFRVGALAGPDCIFPNRDFQDECLHLQLLCRWLGSYQ
jgi:hypothetical protein